MKEKTKYRYNKQAADRVVNWFKKYLRHTKGPWARKPFSLLPWQIEILENVFGWQREVISIDGRKVWIRKYKEVYIEIAKKNGKTEFLAGIALFMLMADGEQAGEVYSAAADKDQASIVYRLAEIMISYSPELTKRVKPLSSMKRLIYNSTKSYYRALSSDVPTKDGLNASCVVFDELHTQKTPELYNVLTQGSGAARLQPLYVYATTAGYNRQSICWTIHEYALKVKSGVIDNPTFYTCIYAADKDDDYSKEKTWRKANPALGHTILMQSFIDEYKKAVDMPSTFNNWLRLRLNIWTSSEVKWISPEKYDLCGQPVNWDSLKGRDAWLGLDLSSTTDITAIVAAIPDDDDFYDIYCKFFIPSENIVRRSQVDKVPYEQWVREGYITATPGDVIDLAFIRAEILRLSEYMTVKEVAYDRYGATETVTILQEEGLTMVPFGQGFVSMNPAVDECEIKLLQGKLRHDNNPVLAWMFDNTMLKLDEAGNRKPDKKRSTEKIDGVVALLMALYRASIGGGNEKSIYESQDLKTL